MPTRATESKAITQRGDQTIYGSQRVARSILVAVSAVFIGIAGEGLLLLKTSSSSDGGGRLALGIAAMSIGAVAPFVIAIWMHKSPADASNVIVVRGDRLRLPRGSGGARQVAISDIHDIKLGYDQLAGGAAWGVLICKKDGTRTLVGGYGLRATSKDPSGSQLEQMARCLRADVLERQRNMGPNACNPGIDVVTRSQPLEVAAERALAEFDPPNPPFE